MNRRSFLQIIIWPAAVIGMCLSAAGTADASPASAQALRRHRKRRRRHKKRRRKKPAS